MWKCGISIQVGVLAQAHISFGESQQCTLRLSSLSCFLFLCCGQLLIHFIDGFLPLQFSLLGRWLRESLFSVRVRVAVRVRVREQVCGLRIRWVGSWRGTCAHPVTRCTHAASRVSMRGLGPEG
jgi:hypothetical protein